VSSNEELISESQFSGGRGLNKFLLLYDDALKRKQRKEQIYSK
jgi:hypothetical protein